MNKQKLKNWKWLVVLNIVENSGDLAIDYRGFNTRKDAVEFARTRESKIQRKVFVLSNSDIIEIMGSEGIDISIPNKEDE